MRLIGWFVVARPTFEAGSASRGVVRPSSQTSHWKFQARLAMPILMQPRAMPMVCAIRPIRCLPCKDMLDHRADGRAPRIGAGGVLGDGARFALRWWMGLLNIPRSREGLVLL